MDRKLCIKLLQDFLDGRRLNSEELKLLEQFLVKTVDMVRQEK